MEEALERRAGMRVVTDNDAQKLYDKWQAKGLQGRLKDRATSATRRAPKNNPKPKAPSKPKATGSAGKEQPKKE